MEDKRKIYGFTLMEIIMVIILLAIFSLGLGYFIMRAADSWQFLTSRYKAEQDARLCFNFIVRDLREISVDEHSDPEISSADSTSITFTNSDGDQISYSLSSNILYRNSDPLVANIGSFQLQYYNKQMNEIINPTPGQLKQIWLIKVNLTLIIGKETLSYYSYVFSRNFIG
jgi:prepilin-type N-terminal cleavage/methylation domain-containing protein